MPQSIEAIGFTTIFLALLLVWMVFYQRRWGTDDTEDSLVVLWRRWAALGKPEAQRVAAKKKRKPAPRKRPPTKPIAEAAVVPEPEPAKPEPAQPEPEPAPEPAEPEPAEPEPAEPQARERVRASRPRLSFARRMKNGSHDHVPLATAEEQEELSDEPKVALRQRFRRVLRRTRERLGAEMREAFTGGATPQAFDRLEEALVASDVGVATATTLVDPLREQIGLSDKTLPAAMREVMVSQLETADRRLRLVRGRLSVWVVVGVNGTGKTTTIAKLAARSRDLGLSVCLGAADTFRAAAVAQLSEWGKRLSIPVVKQGQGADPGAVVFDAIAHSRAEGHRLLIVDTAGRLHTRKPLMDELQKVFRVVEREEDAVVAETLLVIDATTGQNGISQAKAFKDAVDVTGLVLAKLDGTAKGGIAFAVERELELPVKAVGVGEKESDIVPFEPGAFVDALIGEASAEPSGDATNGD